MTAGLLESKKDASMQTSLVKVLIGALAAIVFIIALPYIQLGVVYSYWTPDKESVDRTKCTCSCWDTIFKGSYSSGTVSGYKHVYFNITPQTFKIWALTLVVIVVTYETVKHLVQLAISNSLRLSMFILFASVVYPHYYSWWSYFNAWNDDFYQQWFHQAFFSLTELVSTVLVVLHCDKSRTVNPRLLLVIVDIAVLHIAASGFDQFVSNVIMGKGKWHQVTRDIGFMVPDLLHILLPLFEIWMFGREHGLTFTQCFQKSDLLMSGAGIAILWFICMKL